jgi:hypothetical protein
MADALEPANDGRAVGKKLRVASENVAERDVTQTHGEPIPPRR